MGGGSQEVQTRNHRLLIRLPMTALTLSLQGIVDPTVPQGDEEHTVCSLWPLDRHGFLTLQGVSRRLCPEVTEADVNKPDHKGAVKVS